MWCDMLIYCEFLCVWIQEVLKGCSTINYLVKFYVDLHTIKEFNCIYNFPVDVTYIWGVLSKTSIE